MRADSNRAFTEFLRQDGLKTILDVGPGDGQHAQAMAASGLAVTAVDLDRSTGRGYQEVEFGQVFDGIWCSHVLEHQRNPGAFLDNLHRDLKEGGVLAITVPPQKRKIAGGHVTVWTAGTLLYQLILSGFDCSRALVMHYGYNISVIVRKASHAVQGFHYDSRDLGLIAPLLPPEYRSFSDSGQDANHG